MHECWYTGLKLICKKSPYDRKKIFLKSKEHMIPKSYGIDQYLSVKENEAVTVVASAYINNSLMDAPIIVRYNMRQKLHSFDFKEKDYDQILTIINNSIEKEFDKWTVCKRLVWQDGYLTGTDFKVKYFSTGNPYVKVTESDLDQRSFLMKKIYEADNEFLIRKLGKSVHQIVNRII